jgi:hypothetical protein
LGAIWLDFGDTFEFSDTVDGTIISSDIKKTDNCEASISHEGAKFTVSITHTKYDYKAIGVNIAVKYQVS